ncbi:MAG: neocarzinostatin apoprotein domain-containing protein [Acidimicrobiia bacterium]
MSATVSSVRPIVAFALAGLVLAACSSGKGTAAPTTTGAPPTTRSRALSSPVDPIDPAETTVDPTVTATPKTELANGQRITVRVTGFGVDSKVWLSECASVSDLSDVGCGPRLAAQPFLMTDKHRAGSAMFVVHDRAPVMENNSTDVRPCVSACLVFAAGGGGFAYTPISFKARSRVNLSGPSAQP